MTVGQPSRINDKVPSKSNSTWLMCGRGENPGRISSEAECAPVMFKALSVNLTRPQRSMDQWLRALAYLGIEGAKKGEI
jgi:hypothetical protein